MTAGSASRAAVAVSRSLARLAVGGLSGAAWWVPPALADGPDGRLGWAVVSLAVMGAALWGLLGSSWFRAAAGLRRFGPFAAAVSVPTLCATFSAGSVAAALVLRAFWAGILFIAALVPVAVLFASLDVLPTDVG